MTSKKGREFLRSHVLGLVAIFIALTGTAVAGGSQSGTSDGQNASTSAVTGKKFKALKARVAALEAKPAPTSLPPSGPAGGDLTGTYPNPLLGPNTVGASQLKGVTFVQGTGVAVTNGTSQEAIVDCPAGTRVLNGGAEWQSDIAGTSLIYSVPSPALPNTRWVVKGRVAGGAGNNVIFAEAACIAV